jgi:hypothetical protein
MIDKTKPIALLVERFSSPETARITAAPEDVADLLAKVGVRAATTIRVDYGDRRAVGTGIAVIYPDGGIDWTTALRELDPPTPAETPGRVSWTRTMLGRLLDAHDEADAKYGVSGSSAARQRLSEVADEAREMLGRSKS